MGMELLVANITGKTRRETLNGREYIVAPLSLIVPGILDGSGGPLLYPLEELAKNPSIWNGVPIVVNHPIDNSGNQTSAKTPTAMDGSIGIVFNANVNGKLTAEGWFDVANTERTDNRILHALQSGHTVELSTGLSADRVPVENESDEFDGTYKGKKYGFVARNYRPDHLAILPDAVGACSLQDGCGVMVNENEKQTVFGYIKEYFKGGHNMPLSKADKATLVDGIVANCDCWSNEDRETLNGLSDEKLGVLKKHVGKLKAIEESSKAREAVVNAAKQGFEDQQGNAHTFNDKTGKWETKVKEEKKDSVLANTKGAEQGTTEKPQTSEDWMKSAPPEIQSTIRNAMRIEAEEKAGLITRLVANVKDDTKPRIIEGLKLHSIETLRDLVTLVPVPDSQAQANTPSYAGASAPLVNAGADDIDEDDTLALPTINWAEESK